MERRSSKAPSALPLGRPERVTTLLVQAHLADRTAAPPNLIARLRDMEQVVREARGDRQTLQVIASGRRLLGDAEDFSTLEPAFEPDLPAPASVTG